MAVDMTVLRRDLAAESAELERVLAELDEGDWDRLTPAAPWSIRDQITHLAFFDELATLAAVDPERFAEEARLLGPVDDGIGDRVAARFREVSGADALSWFRTAGGEYLECLANLDPAVSVPWFGPPMSVASSMTARLMETWAHGQDVFDALGLHRSATSRLRHIAHLGVQTVDWSFRVHGLPPPDAPIRVELTAPDGSRWAWGPQDAPNRVLGPAEDFCLLVTQRRHRRQTAMQATGGTADAWLDLAQAFAGPPGAGRPSPR